MLEQGYPYSEQGILNKGNHNVNQGTCVLSQISMIGSRVQGRVVSRKKARLLIGCILLSIYTLKKPVAFGKCNHETKSNLSECAGLTF